MKKILYMHSGSGNHGCEALVRTTANLLEGPENVVLWSGNRQQDACYGSAAAVERVVQDEELGRFTPAYFEAQFRRLVLRQADAFERVFLRKLFRNNVAVSIGGDNYCYPWSAREGARLNRQLRKVCKGTVLWGCSIDAEAITPEIREDLAAYDLITAREPITYALLREINPNTVQVADPAFLLETEYLPLPEGFREGNTVGINVSPLIMHYGSGSLILKNYEALVQHILEHTDLHICLIPHVVWEGNDDRQLLTYLMEKFGASGRVCMVSDANCCQLKGYIARCRFFVGARTHATIAAYSSCVPTLVTGYSVKARGIARDLFGTDENYVLPVQAMQKEMDLARAFDWLRENEKAVKTQLETVIPAYKERAELGKTAFEEMLRK